MCEFSQILCHYDVVSRVLYVVYIFLLCYWRQRHNIFFNKIIEVVQNLYCIDWPGVLTIYIISTVWHYSFLAFNHLLHCACVFCRSHWVVCAIMSLSGNLS